MDLSNFRERRGGIEMRAAALENCFASCVITLSRRKEEFGGFAEAQ
jgi:hypothetical protein